MSKKGKGVVFDSTPCYGVGPHEDAKARARLKHQNLIQDYEDLQREIDAMRNKLDAANMRKLILAAEVRFLRKRYKYLVRSKSMDSSQEQSLVPTKAPLKQATSRKDPFFIRKEATRGVLPMVPRPKKTQRHVVEEAFIPTDGPHKKRASNCSSTPIKTPVCNPNPTEKNRTKKGASPNTALFPDERAHCANSGLRNPTATFDPNGCPNKKEASFHNRAPIFDLNEISTGEEDFGISVELSSLEESKQSVIRCVDDEHQNDLKLVGVCRNLREGSTRVGKRKISWHDPVAV